MNKKQIGIFLSNRRRFLKVTQKNLADISEISERTLRDIEKGVANPEMESVLKLCNVLGLEININVIK